MNRDRTALLEARAAERDVAGPGSLTGRYPGGNTGGANVSAFRSMPIPDDLRQLLEARVPAESR